MNEGENSIQVPEFTDRILKNPAKRQKLSCKPLFKMTISDLQSLEFDPDTDSFIFKNHNLSLVMCGGKITDIFRDDLIFSFELDDGSGTILCFHKFKYDREAVRKQVNELPTTAQFLQTTFTDNQTRNSDDETIFNATNNDTMTRSLENGTSETFRVMLSWFNEEVVEKQKAPNVGDSIHVVGHLLQQEGQRKINVIDFRMVSKEDREDLAMEIDYLNRCIY